MMGLRVEVDARNPGQYFACCGLLELASRLCGAATGCFVGTQFEIDAPCSLADLIAAFAAAPKHALDPNGIDESSEGAEGDEQDEEDEAANACPIHLGAPFGVRLDWWTDTNSGGKELKVWAGSMNGLRVFCAMADSLRNPEFHSSDLFSRGCVVPDPDDPKKKVEPFYFDSRRAANARSIDIGFSPNSLKLTTTAYPAVEALCLVGLQRFRPARTSERRVFEYRTWNRHLPALLASPVAAGLVPFPGTEAYRFENWFRTGQKKHKAFRNAVPII